MILTIKLIDMSLTSQVSFVGVFDVNRCNQLSQEISSTQNIIFAILHIRCLELCVIVKL